VLEVLLARWCALMVRPAGKCVGSRPVTCKDIGKGPGRSALAVQCGEFLGGEFLDLDAA
jgi:hypothetical protein